MVRRVDSNPRMRSEMFGVVYTKRQSLLHCNQNEPVLSMAIRDIARGKYD